MATPRPEITGHHGDVAPNSAATTSIASGPSRAQLGRRVRTATLTPAAAVASAVRYKGIMSVPEVPTGTVTVSSCRQEPTTPTVSSRSDSTPGSTPAIAVPGTAIAAPNNRYATAHAGAVAHHGQRSRAADEPVRAPTRAPPAAATSQRVPP